MTKAEGKSTSFALPMPILLLSMMSGQILSSAEERLPRDPVRHNG